MLLKYILYTYEDIVISIQLDECPQNEHIYVTIIQIQKQNRSGLSETPGAIPNHPSPIHYQGNQYSGFCPIRLGFVFWLVFFFHLYEFGVGVLHFSKLFIIAGSRTKSSFNFTVFSIKWREGKGDRLMGRNPCFSRTLSTLCCTQPCCSNFALGLFCTWRSFLKHLILILYMFIL